MRRMMSKKDAYRNITPLPTFIPRQLVLDILHSHGEIITLNPLVLEHHAISSPRDAPAEEYYSTWYQITERIQVVPGTGKLGSGKISFRACFHDVPWGVQTHVYAPMGIDLRHNYRVGGNQPGEPPEHRELGSGAPASGLYLREDIEIRCNFAMTSFVRSQLKAATKVLVDRLIKKAELLDAGVLRAMMDQGGRLKTINPADRSQPAVPQPSASSPTQTVTTTTMTTEAEDEVVPMYSPPQYQPSSSHQGSYGGEESAPPFSPSSIASHAPTGSAAAAVASRGKSFANELPGDTSYYHQIPVAQQQKQQHSPVSSDSGTGWSSPSYFNSSRPTSYSTQASAPSSAPYGQQQESRQTQFAVELPTTHEEGAGNTNRGLGLANMPASAASGGDSRSQGWHVPTQKSNRY